MGPLTTMEVVILDDKMPRSLTMLIKLPGGEVRTAHAHWDIAASQFTPGVTKAISDLVEQVIESHGVRPRKPNRINRPQA